MKLIKGESKDQSWIWFKSFENRLFTTFSKVQDIWNAWRAYLLSADFWDLSWLWTSLLLKVCSFKIMLAVGQGAKQKLMSWVSNRVPKRFVAESFPTCFKDGILLCALAEKVAPGACPRFDLLDPDQPLRNLKLALHLVEKHIQIKPPITAEEILQGGAFAEKRLLLLIAQMKMASEKFALPPPSPKHCKDITLQNTFVSKKCLARGMGLLVAVRDRKARFSIIVESIENLDMIIEIRGPNNTACSKRITSAMSLSRKSFAGVKSIQDAQIEEEILRKKIPVEYTILGQNISVCYTPLESGKHTMSIICQGQHIVGSPYTISVDNSTDSPDIWDKTSIGIHSQPRYQNKQCFDKSGEKKGLVARSETSGRIVKRRVLRYIVKVEGNDVVIDGKEDLCEAINRVKNQLRKVSLKGEETETVDSKFASENNFTDSERRHKTNSLPNLDLNVLSYAVSDSAPCENIAKDCDENCDGLDLKNHTLSKKFNNCSIPDNVGTYSKFDLDTEHKAVDDHSQIESPDNKLKVLSVVDNTTDVVTESETSVGKIEKKDIHELNNNLSDERDIKLHLYQRNNDFSESDLNSNSGTEIRRNSATDDVSFYPVHKVEYEQLHDDEEEPEEQCVYNPKRRKSYTELFESNYLDGDIEMVDVVKVSEIEIFCPGIENNEDTEKLHTSDSYLTELEKHGPGDIRNCLRANHDLFQCDHNLGFWSETVTETPPEFVSCESNKDEIDSEIHEDNPSKNDHLENLEPAEYEEVTLELDKASTIEKVSLENEEEIHFVESTHGNEACAPVESISVSLKNTDLNKFEDNDDLELIRKLLLKELPDNKKRSSWPDRDHLPCIRESSIEDFLDLETCENEEKNTESKDNNASFVTASETESKQNDNGVLFPSSSAETPVKLSAGESSQSELSGQINVPFSSSNTNFSVMNLTKEYESNTISDENSRNPQQKIDDTNRYAFSSMNILSASPYKSRNGNKHSEIKFTPLAQFERPRSQSECGLSIPSNTDNEASSSTQALLNGFILTHAVPAVVNDHQDVPEDKCESSDEVISEEMHLNTNLDLNAYGQGITKPPSVKKVMEIFQKDKEEPLDTWPTEFGNLRSNRKKSDDDMLVRKSPERSESPDPKNCLLSCMEASRSTIKDRVKVFESDEKKDSAAASKKNIVQKQTVSTISDKKKYWENFMS